MENSMKNMLNWYVPGSQFFTSDYTIGSQAFNKELMTTLGQGAQKAAPIVSMFNPIVGIALGGAGKMQEQIGVKKTKDHAYCKGCYFDSDEKCKFKTKCHLKFGEIYKLKIIIKLEEKRF